MVFGRRFFIILFTGFFSFISLQIIYRKAMGLDMITFRQLMEYFSSLSINDFLFDDAIVNFINTIADFSFIDWPSVDNFIDAVKNIYEILVGFFKYIWGTIKTLYELMYSVMNDMLVIVNFFKNFFWFCFT